MGVSKHGQFRNGHAPLEINPKSHPNEAVLAQIEGIAQAAFSDPKAVLDEVKDSLKRSKNPDRIRARYYAIFTTLFRDRVFQDNDIAWKSLMKVSSPGSADWGDTPDGTGFTVFGLALRSVQNPDAVLDRLIYLSEYTPSETKRFELKDVPAKARAVHIMTAAWSEVVTSGLGGDEILKFDRNYPDPGRLDDGVVKAKLAFDVCQDHVYENVLKDRALEVRGEDGERIFDNQLLWESFIRATARTPSIVRLLVEHKKDVNEGNIMSSFNRMVSFLEGGSAASINIEPQVGFLMVEAIGTGHPQMLADYGVAPEDRHLFLPGAITMRRDKPVFQITGGLAGTPVDYLTESLTLVGNHLRRIGFGPDLKLSAYTGKPEALETTIGDLTRGQDIEKAVRRSVVANRVESINSLGEHGYLVVDKEGIVYDLQEGSVVLAPVTVMGYCYYRRKREADGEKICLCNVKAKHFDISSNQQVIAEALEKVMERGRIIQTEEWK